MNLRSSILALLLLASPWALAAQTDAPVEAFTAVAPAVASQTILPAGTAGAADELSYSARCHELNFRTSVVSLGWRNSSGEGLGGVRVDISKLREGFATGRYETTRVLGRGAQEVAVEAPEPGINYYWRVLTESADGWISSRVERFEVPICVWDEPNLEQFPAAISGTAANGPDAN